MCEYEVHTFWPTTNPSTPSPISFTVPLNSCPKPIGTTSLVNGCGVCTGANAGPPFHSCTSYSCVSADATGTPSPGDPGRGRTHRAADAAEGRRDLLDCGGERMRTGMVGWQGVQRPWDVYLDVSRAAYGLGDFFDAQVLLAVVPGCAHYWGYRAEGRCGRIGGRVFWAAGTSFVSFGPTSRMTLGPRYPAGRIRGWIFSVGLHALMGWCAFGRCGL